ncbi:MAG TPA: glycogen synthase GlgA [Chthonomonadaceae bacterium]|nr:glycogen synthase GlgA [Chthonomonadaceae bacterium]
MKILIISAEVAPFAKVGGLADVAGALPKALKRMGHDVRVAMPCYRMIETNPAFAVRDVLAPFPVRIRTGVAQDAFVRGAAIQAGSDAVPVYLIGNRGEGGRPGYFEEATDSTKVYTVSPEPYVFFCHAVLETIKRLEGGWTPDVLHCNDWHSGLVPVFARTSYADDPAVSPAASVFTIHNLAYQGGFDRSEWAATGLPDRLFHPSALEFYGGWSFMKGGLTFSDRVNTVSETYAGEIQTAEYGCGLEGLTQTLCRTERLSGILNGIDYEEYDPATDRRIARQFSGESPEGKAVCKAALQAELGLKVSPRTPLVGLVSRLADQKGLDLIRASVEEMLALPVQLALLGTGDRAYEAYFCCLQERYPGRVHARIAFDVELAQRIYAGSDLFLMPSRFEPCGLGQMMALRYGTVPIVRATGGLADSIVDVAAGSGDKGNGFVFTDYSAAALLDTVKRAAGLYRREAAWTALVRHAMHCDFSWSRSAAQYEALYAAAVTARRLQRPIALERGAPAFSPTVLKDAAGPKD